MKKLILLSTLLIGCSSWPSFPGVKDKPVITKAVPETPRERLTNDLEVYLSWAAVAATLATILTFALGWKIPGLHHVSFICGIVAASCAMAIYALGYIWLIIGVSFWSLIAWGAYHIYKKSKEIKKHMGIVEELATNFENPNGEELLSSEADYHYKRHRSKGIKKDGSLWGVDK